MKKNNVKWIIIFVVIVAVMIATTLYYTLEKDTFLYKTYKGIKGEYKYAISEQSGVKFYDININVFRNGQTYKHIISTRYSPEELESIPFDNIRDKIINTNVTRIYLSQDPNLPIESETKSVLALYEINSITGCDVMGACVYGFSTKNAVTKSTPEYEKVNIPEKNCEDATFTEPVVILKIDKENKIYEEKPYCFILEADSKDNLIKVADKFIMHLVGIF